VTTQLQLIIIIIISIIIIIIIIIIKKKEPRCVCLREAKASQSHKMWTEVSSSVPHFLQVGLLLSLTVHKCLLKVLCPVSKPATTLDCVLLKDNSEAAVHITIQRYLVPIPNRYRAHSHYTWSITIMFLIHHSEECQASRD